MYQDILYTLSVPERGSTIQGVSKASNKLVSTCSIAQVKPLGRVKDCEAYRCMTQHETVYLIYVLPSEVNMGRIFRREYAALSGHRGFSANVCTYPGCSGYTHRMTSMQSVNALKQIRWLLIVLAILSVLIGSNGEIGAKLWTLFLTMIRLLFPL